MELNLTVIRRVRGHTWQVYFDIATFVWRELDDWAQRTLREIHVIRWCIRWSEDDPSQLSARRRQMLRRDDLMRDYSPRWRCEHFVRRSLRAWRRSLEDTALGV